MSMLLIGNSNKNEAVFIDFRRNAKLCYVQDEQFSSKSVISLHPVRMSAGQSAWIKNDQDKTRSTG